MSELTVRWPSGTRNEPGWGLWPSAWMLGVCGRVAWSADAGNAVPTTRARAAMRINAVHRVRDRTPPTSLWVQRPGAATPAAGGSRARPGPAGTAAGQATSGVVRHQGTSDGSSISITCEVNQPREPLSISCLCRSVPLRSRADVVADPLGQQGAATANGEQPRVPPGGAGRCPAAAGATASGDPALRRVAVDSPAGQENRVGDRVGPPHVG